MILSHSEAIEAVRRGKRVVIAAGLVAAMDGVKKRPRDDVMVPVKIGVYGNEKSLEYDRDELRNLLVGVIANDVAWLTGHNCQVPKIDITVTASDLRQALKQEFTDGTTIEAPDEKPAALPAHGWVGFDDDDDDGL